MLLLARRVRMCVFVSVGKMERDEESRDFKQQDEVCLYLTGFKM